MTCTNAQARARRWPHVSRDDLASDAALLQLARRLVRDGFLPRTEWSCFRVFAAAEHSLARGDSAGALFSWTLRNDRVVTEAEAARGEARARAARAHGRASFPLRPRLPEPDSAIGELPELRAARAVAARVRALGSRAGARDLQDLELAQANAEAAIKRARQHVPDRHVASLGRLVLRLKVRPAATSPA